MTRIYSLSLGCPKNLVDTEHALGALTPFGPVLPVDQPEDADLVFVNTCGFIGPAIEESVRTVVDLIHRLQQMEAADRPLLAVAGCLVGRFGRDTLAPDLPEADLLLDTSDLSSWGSALVNALSGAGRLSPARSPAKDAQTGSRLLSTGPSYAWLKISDGCRHACSFCTIPSIRGALVSTPKQTLVAEAQALLGQGVKELILIAQDLTAWGMDTGRRNGLIPLLEGLLPLAGLDRLRLMYLYPAGLTRELLDFLRQAGPPFVPYFDVPLQHASQSVLSRMGRPFAGRPQEAVDRIRDVFPDAALRTSLITGFPGETEEDFAQLLRFVETTRFHHLGVFAYQAEAGTPAAAMPDQIPDAVKEYRRDAIMEVQGEISADIMESYVGQRLDVLVDAAHEEWPGLYVGRTWFQAPGVDGLTYVSGPGVVPGALVGADVTESGDYDLVALA